MGFLPGRGRGRVCRCLLAGRTRRCDCWSTQTVGSIMQGTVVSPELMLFGMLLLATLGNYVAIRGKLDSFHRSSASCV